MKTLPALSFLAALVAFVLFPHTLALSGSLLFSACLITIFVADCARTIKPVDTRSTLLAFPRPTRRASAFELAA
jgi:hypothetical protein